MCGSVVLAARSGRFLLATPEGSGLCVLESTDGGVTWRPLTAFP
jgi:hypothetical protein